MTYTPTDYSSWAWRKICEVKETLKNGYINGKWRGSDHSYTIADGYKWLMQESDQKVPWYNLVWNRYNVPKCSFIIWLIQHQRLLTLDRLHKMGIVDNTACFLYGVEMETHAHLFQDFIFARQCFHKVAHWLGIPVTGLLDWKKLICLKCPSMFRRPIDMAAMVSTSYYIWHNSNICRLEGYVMHPGKIAQMVQTECKQRVIGIHQGPLKASDMSWCTKIGFL
ncbi:uncharacterized protein LOC141617536 [Silene latifolia]|uniref:uncharacterized protein LOC141617536 n=1 Tax=Silene latifolia TaxID=37657 RepID=UPI003D784300